MLSTLAGPNPPWPTWSLPQCSYWQMHGWTSIWQVLLRDTTTAFLFFFSFVTRGVDIKPFLLLAKCTQINLGRLFLCETVVAGCTFPLAVVINSSGVPQPIFHLIDQVLPFVVLTLLWQLQVGIFHPSAQQILLFGIWGSEHMGHVCAAGTRPLHFCRRWLDARQTSAGSYVVILKWCSTWALTHVLARGHSC